MDDFFTQLVSQQFASEPVVRPVLPPLFSTGPAVGDELPEFSAFDAQNKQDIEQANETEGQQIVEAGDRLGKSTGDITDTRHHEPISPGRKEFSQESSNAVSTEVEFETTLNHRESLVDVTSTSQPTVNEAISLQTNPGIPERQGPQKIHHFVDQESSDVDQRKNLVTLPVENMEQSLSQMDSGILKKTFSEQESSGKETFELPRHENNQKVPETTVKVHIGKVELKQSSWPLKYEEREEPQDFVPTLSLNTYLERRNGSRK